MLTWRVGNIVSMILAIESGMGAQGADVPTLANSSGLLESLPQGPYTVHTGTISKIPGLSLGGPYSGHVVYPEGKSNHEKFPFLSFAHGTGAGGALTYSDYKRALELVASYGFVIVAADSCPKRECFSGFSKDQLATIKACKDDPTLHPALANADFNRIGVYGHSMGGMATLVSAQSPNTKNFDISAAVSMHPCKDIYERPALVDIPIMFTAGSNDKICVEGASKSFYETVPVANAGAKIIFDVEGANHFDPTEGEPGLFGPGSGSELPAIALFFSCHLRGESCDKVYGASGKEICNQVAAGRSLADCRVEGGVSPRPPAPTPPAPSPTPAPAPTPAPTPQGKCGTWCEDNGHSPDKCDCGICGSFGSCTFSCLPDGVTRFRCPSEVSVPLTVTV